MWHITEKGFLVPGITRCNASELEITDTFFDSLKQDYIEFEDWFKRISIEKRSAFVLQGHNKEILGFMVIKDENEKIESNPPLEKKRRLKISTLKTEYDKKGHEVLGELLIKIAIIEALKEKIDEIYLTVLEDKEDLMSFLTEYGFDEVSTVTNSQFNRIEKIFLKKIIPDSNNQCLDAVDFNNKYYPSMLVSNVNKYLVPSTPKYHKEFFGWDSNQSRFLDILESEYRKPLMIKKKYISTSGIKKISPGDILLFCRSKSSQGITSIGVVTNIEINDDVEKNHRTVRNPKGIIDKVENNEAKLIITFNHCFDFENIVDLKSMEEIYYTTKYTDGGSTKDVKKSFSIPQSIHPVSDSYFKEVIKKSGINTRYLIGLEE